MSDAELEAAVAEKVAGWKTERMSGYHAAYCSVDPFSVRGKVAYGSPHEAQADYPRYMTDANAVVALLEKHLWECWVHENGDYSVRLSQTSPPTRTKGFCRAACLALLKAHGQDCGKEGV
jgi:hypothetical protein